VDESEKERMIRNVQRLSSELSDGFREEFILAVELGELLNSPDMDPADCGITQHRAEVFIDLAKRFPHCGTYTPGRWDALQEQWSTALSTWLVVIDPKTKPRKKARALRVLRANELSLYAYLSVEALKDIKNGL
jgi:hypothetical protein